jgi:hypothetical protein
MSIVDAINIVERMKSDPVLYGFTEEEIEALTRVQRAAAGNLEAE